MADGDADSAGGKRPAEVAGLAEGAGGGKRGPGGGGGRQKPAGVRSISQKLASKQAWRWPLADPSRLQSQQYVRTIFRIEVRPPASPFPFPCPFPALCH